MKDERDNTGNDGFLPPERVAWLIAGYLRQTLSEKEHDELDDWIIASDDNQQLFEEMISRTSIKKGLKEMRGVSTEKMLKRIKERISFSEEKKKKSPPQNWLDMR